VLNRSTQYLGQPLGAVLKLRNPLRQGGERADFQQPIKLHRRRGGIGAWAGIHAAILGNAGWSANERRRGCEVSHALFDTSARVRKGSGRGRAGVTLQASRAVWRAGSCSRDVEAATSLAFWAAYYPMTAPSIAIAKDVDLLSTRADVERLARGLGGKAAFPHKQARSPRARSVAVGESLVFAIGVLLVANGRGRVRSTAKCRCAACIAPFLACRTAHCCGAFLGDLPN
jgi:hypothetical protein